MPKWTKAAGCRAGLGVIAAENGSGASVEVVGVVAIRPHNPCPEALNPAMRPRASALVVVEYQAGRVVSRVCSVEVKRLSHGRSGVP